MGAGYVFLREGFEYGDFLFALLGQPRVTGHNQRDRTAFIIEAFGEHLAMDPGMISYANPIHTSLANTRLHNAISIDGKDSRTQARVTGFFSSPFADFAAVDGTPAYPQAKNYLRRALYLRPDHVVILDDISLKSAGRIEWNLNSAGELSLDGVRVLARAKRSTLVADFATPRAMNLDTEVWPCGYPGLKNHHGTLWSEERSDAARFLVSLYPVRRGQEGDVECEPIGKGGDTCGVRIRRGGQEELVLVDWDGHGIQTGGVRSDAEISMLRFKGGKVSAAAMIGGTTLVWQDAALLSAAESATVSIDYRDGWAAASVQAPPGVAVTFARRGGGPFRSVLVGSVAGGFEPGGLETAEAGAIFTVPAGEPPLGGHWLVFDKPAWLDVNPAKRGTLRETLVNDAPPPSGGPPPGTIPETIRMVFDSGSNPFDAGSVIVHLNGRRVPVSAWRVAESAADRTVTVDVDGTKLLTAEELAPRFYTTHRLRVAVCEKGLLRRRVAGHFRFAMRPAVKDDVVYLSDLAPALDFSHKPPTGPLAHGGVIRDRAYSSDRLCLAGIEYPKGLTTHPETTGAGAYAEVVYDVAPHRAKRKTFRALVGMQDGRPGSVTFRVDTRAGNGPWQERTKTGVMTSGADPIDISIPLEGVDAIRLYVTDAGDGIGSDHAVWAMARFE